MYDYMVTTFNVLAGLITEKRLIIISFVSVAILLGWILLQLIFCFQTRFNNKCIKMYNFIKNNTNNTDCMKFVDENANKVSHGFARGWKKFKAADSGKPSDFITRDEALDKEVYGGFLNNGKSIMKSYMWFVTVVLFIFNLSLVGAQSEEVVKSIALALYLPTLTHLVLRIFYYAYTNIRQQIYKSNVEAFSDLLELMGERFEKKSTQPVAVNDFAVTSVQSDVSEDAEEKLELNDEPLAEANEVAEEVEDDEGLEEEIIEENFETKPEENFDLTNESFEEETGDELEEPNTEAALDAEESSEEKSAEPVTLENAEEEVEETPETTEEPQSTEEQETLTEPETEEEPIAEEALEESEEEPAEEEGVSPTEAEETTSENLEEIADKYDIFKKKNIDVNKIINEVPNSSIKSSMPYINVDSEYVINDEFVDEDSTSAKAEEEKAEESPAITKSEEKEPAVSHEKSDNDAASGTETLSERLSEFSKSNEQAQEEKLLEIEGDMASGSGTASAKKHKSKLASGGVEIIKNDYHKKSKKTEENTGKPNVEIRTLNTDDSANKVDIRVKDEAETKAKKPATKVKNNPQKNVEEVDEPETEDSDLIVIGQPETPNYFDISYSEPVPVPNYFEVGEEAKSEKSGTTKKKTQRRKRIKSNKKGDNEVENSQTKKSRGRPRNEININSLEIADDKQFNDVLARAEKLMRKSEEGLSQSQSKRIENELKALIEAMNKYKEKR